MIFFFLLMGMLTIPALAFDSGSTGADGAFNPTADTEVQLPAAGKLNYTTVNIPAGVTVTFKQNTSNTPVYILATGDVTIAGTINVSGNNANGVANGRGGPGGYDGGLGAYFNSCGGTGLGAGGGKQATIGGSGLQSAGGGGGGGFSAAGPAGANAYNGSNYSIGGTGGSSYGNIAILPLIGGSGGGGGCGSNQSSAYTGGAGGGGGGAILIASSGTIDVSGSILSNGGNGGSATSYSGKGGGGSGGAIKLIANVIKGDGTISATGGSGSAASGGTSNTVNGGNGSNGRIRLEANSLLRTASSTPPFTYLDAPVYVFPPNTPVLKIVSIGGTAVSATPTGKYATPDIVLPTSVTNPVEIGIEASNIPVGTTITVNVVSQLGAPTSTTTTLGGTIEASTATANVTLSPKYVNIVTATATFTVQTAANEMPLYIAGEKVVKMRVDSVLGGRSSITYITESGKEVPAEG